MCSSKTVCHSSGNLDVPYIEDLDQFIQHLMAILDYLVDLPTWGDYQDSYDGHTVMFEDLELTFFAPHMLEQQFII